MTLYVDRKQESRLAQFSLLCSNLVWFIPGTIVVALALSFIGREQMSLIFSISWFFVISAIQVIRIGALRHWMRIPAIPETVQRRLTIATILSCATACCFGLFAFLALAPDTPHINLMVIMVLSGLVASATAAISFLLPMYLLYILPLALPAGLRSFTFGDPGYAFIGGLVLVFIIISIGMSRNIRASILRSIDLRFENSELIEDLKHQHQRAEAALTREEKGNLAKSRFLAAASHDLRQPLHSLRLFTATLEMQTRNSKHKTLVKQIDSSVKSLEELFNALLDISKLDAGTVNVDKNHVYIDNLLMQIEGEFSPLAAQKDIDFKVQLNGHVINSDVILLERLIRNLVDNAFRYTQAGEVIVSSSLNNGRVWISFKDTGIGIPEKERSRIFEEFVQLGNVERDRNQGIGLGLSIVRRLADLLDVQLRLESSEGIGSKFVIGVPQGDAALCSINREPQKSLADQVDSLFILVVDDEEDVCLAVEGLLETWGCIVMCAFSGDAASQQLKEIGDVPDLVISDYRLRDGETGGDVISRLREELACEIPAIILTGDIAPDRLIEIQSLGFPLLHKPCEPEALRQLIARETVTILAEHPESRSSNNTPGNTVARNVG